MSGVNSSPDQLPQIDHAAYERQAHVANEGYSQAESRFQSSPARTLAMTVDHSAKGEELKQQQQEREAKANANSSSQNEGQKSAGQQEKEEMMRKARANTQPNAKDFERKGEREVYDPVTGRNVIVRDAKLEDFQNPQLFGRDNLDPSKSDVPGPSTNVPGGNAPIQHTTPTPVEPSNVLIHTFPPPVEANSLKSIIRTINGYAVAIIGALGVIWFFVAFRAGYTAFLFRSSLIGGLAVCIFSAHGLVIRKVEKELERIRLEMHKQRGEKLSPPTPESVEWLNAYTKVIWPLINPDMFTSVVDMIEDVMQASLPGFIDAVKVEDFTIGKNAFRILNMRALPDQPGEPDYPKEEWIDQGDKGAALDPARRQKKKEEKEKKDDEVLKQEGATPEDEDQTGDYVNMEISFAYFAPPGKEKLQGENISLIIKFFLGMHDLFHLPIPIWIAVESIVGTVRLRCQLVSQSPFIRNVTFTLMGVPAIEASAIPLAKGLPNVLDLPLISGFVKSSIAAATAVYCAPKSMTMNIAQMLSGDGVKRDTKALGVFMITIHHAESLSAQDDNGYSDPYVVIAYSKFGKPLFSTRIIQKDLNPVWEQTTFLLVSDDEVRAGESLSIQLWDSDEISADDLVGRIQVPITELMLEPNEVHRRTDKLMGFEDADSMAGTLTWSVAYYEKAKLNPTLKKEPGIDHTLPKELQDHPELKVEENKTDTPEEADVQRTPPDPQYPAGVLSVIVHQINSLERQNLKGASGKSREGQAGQDTDTPSEQGDNLPSSYCEIIVNDDLVYKTRVKQYSQMPFFEAGTETFVRDFTKTSLRIVVRDARLREHVSQAASDPILGIVDLPLKDVLAHSSEVTRLYALQDGVGFGKVSLSILFKGVKMDLPRELSGWDTGTVCVTAPVKVEPVEGADFDWKEKKLVLSTLEAKQKIPSKAASTLSDRSIEWDVDEDIRLPTYDRYSSALYFDYGGAALTVGPLGKKVEAFAALWLSELVDDEPKEVRLPVVVGEKGLRMNYISDHTSKTHDYTIVGWLTTTVVIDAGLDADHEKYAQTQTARHEYEQYDRIEGQGQQAIANSHANDDGVIDKDEQKAIDKAHKQALESRHRGKMQFAPVRSLVWAKDGMKDRVQNLTHKVTGKKERQETVATEA
ncbi:SPOSA6832_00141, partial [Sporobolomyces salmonicolor]